MSDVQEHSLNTLDIFTEQTLQTLTKTNFTDIAKLVDTNRPNNFQFNIPKEKGEQDKLRNFVFSVLDLSMIAGIKENGVPRSGLMEMIAKSKEDLEDIHRVFTIEHEIASVCLLFSNDTRIKSTTRTPIPFTGGNLAVWANYDAPVNFTGNGYYNKAAEFLSEKSKLINFKVAK
ncbi:MAG TPA: hypothetical protein VL401_02260 [Alphaproteobacteria bacterium]|jgi:hypothetical protein|nr:hypothetical protein [Alphaproteobacteria bacterium]